ncbi:hypothetical protein [Streptomyces sp. 8N706]|uniref:hypothetical protein n=1 Tax=Streptomyces sp. 8N706 TaxID=3457416 RepID=UPI003FCF5852
MGAAAADAASRAVYAGWALGGPSNFLHNRDLWRGYEDGTATLFLAPGQWLRYQPAHEVLGTTRSLG